MRRGAMTLILAALVLLPGLTRACPFCGEGGKTLTQWSGDAPLIAFGKFANANEDKDTTDLVIDSVIKDDDKLVKGKKAVTVGRYVDTSLLTEKDRFVVFCDNYNGKLDAFKGVATKKDSKLPDYLRGALAIKDAPTAKRLRYFFDHLDSPEIAVSGDAFMEYANADYKDFEPMAKALPADKVAAWLKDPETPALRLGLYASMLGHCGKQKDAKVLRDLLDDADRRQGGGVDGMLAAYVMLEQKEGWKFLQDSLKNTKEDFLFRYAALKAVRFLHEYRSDVAKAQLEEAICVLLTQDDVADLAIEDLRKWRCWDKADRVLAVASTDLNKVPIIRRSILRYAIQATDHNSAAKTYVALREKQDPEAVAQANDLLKLERDVRKRDDTKKK